MSTHKTLMFHPSGENLSVSAMQEWHIVVSDDATAAERYAAEEFEKWFSQATGLTLGLKAQRGDPNRGHITISGSVDLGDEDIEIVVEGGQVQINGGRPRGTLYAVYQFLEELVGIRFLTAEHTHIPDASTLDIPCGSYTYSPPFSFRWSYYQENSEVPEFAAKRKVNTVTDADNLGGKTQQQLINHSFHALVPYGTYGENHPEYYALVDGKRDTDTHRGGPQLCVTNPEVIDVAAESAIQQLSERPEATNISVSQADTAAYCRCEICEALNEAEDSPKLDADALLTEFVNLHYETAAPPILEYITYLHDNVELRSLHPRCFLTPEDVGLDAESTQVIFDYFQRALALAEKSEIRARVEKAAIPAYKAMIVAGGEMPSEKRQTLIEEYMALCERYNMSHASETQTAEAYFEELRNQYF